MAGGALYLISDNEHYQPEMITPQQMGEVEILGRCEVQIGRFVKIQPSDEGQGGVDS